jgi:SNF2 family DNA or RNA helicase
MQLQSSVIVLTTYTTVAFSAKSHDSNNPNKRSILHQIQWGRIVFDEAHHLRNSNTRHHASKLLQSKIRWLISGTPIQNKRTDFYNLCASLNIPVSYYSDPSNISNIVKLFVLRRTKLQVGISIPPIHFHLNNISWNQTDERTIAHEIHNQRFYPLQKGDHLKWFILSRMSCVYPTMLLKHTQSLLQLPSFHSTTQIYNAILNNSKIDSVVQLIISRNDNGNGKLVFCHFKEELDIIFIKLQNAGIQDICVFDGRLSHLSRLQLIKQSFKVVLLQIQIGCEGINLQQHFSEIYFVSPHWNPAIEDQAIARCHRIGQLKPVHVFRFFMDSIPHKSESELDKEEEDKPEEDNPEEEKELLESKEKELLESKEKELLESKEEELPTNHFSIDQYISIVHNTHTIQKKYAFIKF